MKGSGLVLFVALTGTAELSATRVTCNERALHGRVGALKGIATLIGVAAIHHLGKRVWSNAEALRANMDALQARTPNDATTGRACSVIALAALGYVVYKLASEATRSLSIFFNDDVEKEEITR